MEKQIVKKKKKKKEVLLDMVLEKDNSADDIVNEVEVEEDKKVKAKKKVVEAEEEIESDKKVKKKEAKKLDQMIVLDIKIQIDDTIIEADLNKMLHVPKFNQLTPEIVSNILAETPALHARWNVLYNQSCQAYEKYKVDIDVWHSKSYEKYRNQIILDGEKPTEGRIDNLIKQDPDYKHMQYELTELKQKMNTIKAAAIGFGSRGDKVVSIGHMLKREMSTLNDTETKIYDNI